MRGFYQIKEKSRIERWLTKRFINKISNGGGRFMRKQERQFVAAVKKSAGFKLLKVDDKNIHMEYERDVASAAHVISRRGAVPDQFVMGERVSVVPFEIAAAPIFSIASIRRNGRKLLKTTVDSAAKVIRRELDCNVVNALRHAAESKGDQVIISESVDETSVSSLVQMIVRHRTIPSNFVCNPAIYSKLRLETDLVSFQGQYLSLKESLEKEEYGEIEGIPVVVTEAMPEDELMLTASPDDIGVLSVGDYGSLTPYHEPKMLRVSIVCVITVGIIVLRDYNVAILKLRNKKETDGNTVGNMVDLDSGNSSLNSVVAE